MRDVSTPRSNRPTLLAGMARHLPYYMNLQAPLSAQPVCPEPTMPRQDSPNSLTNIFLQYAFLCQVFNRICFLKADIVYYFAPVIYDDNKTPLLLE